MTPEEAQQAQTIKRIELEIKLGRATMINDGEAKMKANVVSLLEIVDSQARKIAELQGRVKSHDAIRCDFCEGTGGFCVEETGEIITCERCNGSGKHILRVKQYTEEELREMYYRDCGDAALNMVPFEWFARFLGVIKEKEG